MTEEPPWHVAWRRAEAHGKPIDRWFASLDRPALTFAFAQVERRPDRTWWLIIYPKWTLRDHPQLKTMQWQYSNARTAKRHLEGWVIANGERLLRVWRMRTDR